jgi:hypothetical protein
LYIRARIVPDEAYYKFSFQVDVAGSPRHSGTSVTPVKNNDTLYGWQDFFFAGPMAGGWDAAAWASTGLPAEGELVLTLKVTGLAHTASSAASQCLMM